MFQGEPLLLLYGVKQIIISDCKVRSLEGLGVENTEFLPLRWVGDISLLSQEKIIRSRSSLGYYIRPYHDSMIL